MPPYSQSLGSLGSAIGGAGGAGIGTGLGSLASSILSPLDYPRQATANLWKAITGQGDWSAAIPGLAGLAAGGLAATGFGLPAGIALGSLVGGLGQGAGKAINPEKFQAPTTEDVSESLGLDRDNPFTNFAVGALTDPLTYAGGIGGAKTGAKGLGELGERIGARADVLKPGLSAGFSVPEGRSALSRMITDIREHPRFSPEAVDIGALSQTRLPRAKQSWDATGSHLIGGHGLPVDLDEIEAQHQALINSLAGETPGGAKLAGFGAESAALHNPYGGITKITVPESFSPSAAYDLPELVPQARVANIGGMTVSHEPRLVPGSELPVGPAVKASNELEDALNAKGIDWWDKGVRNMGVDPRTGQSYVLDPGSIQNIPQGTEIRPTVTPGQGEQPQGLLEKYLLAPMIQRDIRREIAQRTGAEPGALESFMKQIQEAPTNVGGAEAAPVRGSRLERFLGGQARPVPTSQRGQLEGDIMGRLERENTDFRKWREANPQQVAPNEGSLFSGSIQADVQGQIDDLIRQGRIVDAAAISKMRERGLIPEGGLHSGEIQRILAGEPLTRLGPQVI